MTLIKITHMVNPHLMWFKYHPEHAIEENIIKLENELTNTLQNDTNFSIIEMCYVNDYVAVEYAPWQRFIRAVIKEVIKTDTTSEQKVLGFIVWAIDYGFPLFSSNKYIRLLPLKFYSYTNHIHRGGLVNVIPCGLTDISKLKWNHMACAEVGALLLPQENTIDMSIRFIEHVDNIDHFWFDVEVSKPGGVIINPRILLNELHLGEIIELGMFRSISIQLQTLKDNPWIHDKGIVQNYPRNPIQEFQEKQYVDAVSSFTNFKLQGILDFLVMVTDCNEQQDMWNIIETQSSSSKNDDVLQQQYVLPKPSLGDENLELNISQKKEASYKLTHLPEQELDSCSCQRPNKTQLMNAQLIVATLPFSHEVANKSQKFETSKYCCSRKCQLYGRHVCDEELLLAENLSNGTVVQKVIHNNVKSYLEVVPFINKNLRKIVSEVVPVHKSSNKSDNKP